MTSDRGDYFDPGRSIDKFIRVFPKPPQPIVDFVGCALTIGFCFFPFLVMLFLTVLDLYQCGGLKCVRCDPASPVLTTSCSPSGATHNAKVPK